MQYWRIRFLFKYFDIMVKICRFRKSYVCFVVIHEIGTVNSSFRFPEPAWIPSKKSQNFPRNQILKMDFMLNLPIPLLKWKCIRGPWRPFSMSRKVASSRPVYYSILESLGQRLQYISIKFLLHKQSENPKMCY